MSDQEWTIALDLFLRGLKAEENFRTLFLGDAAGNKVVSGRPELVYMRDESGNVERVLRGSININAPTGTPFFVGSTPGFGSGAPQAVAVAWPQLGDNYNGESFQAAYVGDPTAVAFADSEGNITGDSTNFNYDASILRLEYEGDDGGIASPALILTGYSPTDLPVVSTRLAYGTRASPTGVLTGARIYTAQAFGHGATVFTAISNGRLDFIATENHTDTAHGNEFEVLVTPNTTATKVTGFKVLNPGTTAPQMGFSWSGVITPVQITASVNNYNPVDSVSSLAFYKAVRIRISSDSAWNITGLVATNVVDGQIAIFENIGAFDFTLKDSDAASTAANRFLLGADVTLSPEGGAILSYDSTTDRWRLWGGSGSGGGGTGDVVGPGSATDNAIVRFDGTTGKLIQNSAVIVDDTNNITGLTTVTIPNTGLHLLDTNASHDLIIIPGSDLTADRNLTITTGDASRTLTLSGDLNISSGGVIALGGFTLTVPATGTAALGTGTAAQVALWTGTNAVGGDAGLTYVAATDTLTINGGLNVNAAGTNAGDFNYTGDFVANLFVISSNLSRVGIGDAAPDSALEIAALSNEGYITLNEVAPASPAANKLAVYAVDVASTTYLASKDSSGVQKLLYRETLTANRTYYVRTDGSDSNNGLANTAGGAFLTIQKAVDVVSGMLDLNIYTVTIQLGAGTYSITGAIAVTLKQCVGAGNVIILGDTTTPGNVIVTTTTNSAFTFFAAGISTLYTLQGMKLTASGTNPFAIYAEVGGYIKFGALEFGATFFYHLWTGFGGTIRTDLTFPTYTISAGCAVHANATLNSSIVINSVTVTLSGTPAWSTVFANADNTAFVYAVGVTYSGAATGKRYSVTDNAAIQTGTQSETYFPGNALGIVTSGGQYDNQIIVSRATAQFDKTDVTLANITGLSLLVLAGRTYKFIAKLFTTSNIAGGVKAAIAGTATATAIVYESRITQVGAAIATTASRSAAMAGTVANVTAVTAAYITIEGTITVNAAGTLTVQFANNAAVGTSSVLIGSTFDITDITG